MKTRRHAEEWDWPPERRYRPRRHYYAELDVTIPTTTSWVNRAVNVYWRFVVTVFKMVIGAICGVVLVGCVWLIVTIVRL
jgi:hypothetical protein